MFKQYIPLKRARFGIEMFSLCETTGYPLELLCIPMVLCIVWGCGSKSGKHKGLGFFRIPKIITDQGEEYEELTRKRRERWISAVSVNRYLSIISPFVICTFNLLN